MCAPLRPGTGVGDRVDGRDSPLKHARPARRALSEPHVDVPPNSPIPSVASIFLSSTPGLPTPQVPLSHFTSSLSAPSISFALPVSCHSIDIVARPTHRSCPPIISSCPPSPTSHYRFLPSSLCVLFNYYSQPVTCFHCRCIHHLLLLRKQAATQWPSLRASPLPNSAARVSRLSRVRRTGRMVSICLVGLWGPITKLNSNSYLVHLLVPARQASPVLW
jgi:hypothetical protein